LKATLAVQVKGEMEHFQTDTMDLAFAASLSAARDDDFVHEEMSALLPRILKPNASNPERFALREAQKLLLRCSRCPKLLAVLHRTLAEPKSAASQIAHGLASRVAAAASVTSCKFSIPSTETPEDFPSDPLDCDLLDCLSGFFLVAPNLAALRAFACSPRTSLLSALLRRAKEGLAGANARRSSKRDDRLDNARFAVARSTEAAKAALTALQACLAGGDVATLAALANCGGVRMLVAMALADRSEEHLLQPSELALGGAPRDARNDDPEAAPERRAREAAAIAEAARLNKEARDQHEARISIVLDTLSTAVRAAQRAPCEGPSPFAFLSTSARTGLENFLETKGHARTASQFELLRALRRDCERWPQPAD
jgi:hypothetical protein